MTNSHSRKTTLIHRLISGMCCTATCAVALTQDVSGPGPSQARLDRARQLIRQTPSPFESPNPLAVIRVVNCLHSLGRQQAIALLRQIAPEERSTVHDPEDTEEAEEVTKYEDSLWDAQSVSTIVPLLFEVEQGGVVPPAVWYDKDKRQWSIGCGVLVVQDGIPFNACDVWQLEGSLGTTLPLVDWAAAHGKLRETPLDPQDDPLQAADVLYARVVARAVPQVPVQWAQDERGRKKLQRLLRTRLSSSCHSHFETERTWVGMSCGGTSPEGHLLGS